MQRLLKPQVISQPNQNAVFLSIISPPPPTLATNLEAISTCELCKEKLRLNIDNFDIQELYRTHVQVSHHLNLNFLQFYVQKYILLNVVEWEKSLWTFMDYVSMLAVNGLSQ